MLRQQPGWGWPCGVTFSPPSGAAGLSNGPAASGWTRTADQENAPCWQGRQVDSDALWGEGEQERGGSRNHAQPAPL